MLPFRTLLAALLLGIWLLAMGLLMARAHEYADDPQVQAWFEGLKQPDKPDQSCCGEADAYQADDFKVVGGHVVAVITDGRDDTLPDGRVRTHVPPGTQVIIPDEKVKWDKGNPTGHGYVFMTFAVHENDTYIGVFCYIAPAGA